LRAVLSLQGAARMRVARRAARHAAAQARAKRTLALMAQRAAAELRRSRAAVTDALRAAGVAPPRPRARTYDVSVRATFAQCASAAAHALQAELARSEASLDAVRRAERTVRTLRGGAAEWANAAVARASARRAAEVARLSSGAERTALALFGASKESLLVREER
jgi:hypothetical protein